MNDGPPYRARCPEYPSCTLGPLFQHARAAGMAVPQYKNTTTVPGAPVDGTTGKSTIQPLGTADYVDCGDGDTCQGPLYDSGPLIAYNGFNYNGSGGTATDACPATGTVGNSWINLCNTASPLVPANSFAPDSGAGTLNLSPCNQTGWQSVYATRLWQGQFGWLTPDGCASVVCTAGGTYAPYVASPDQVKYLDWAVDCTFSATGTKTSPAPNSISSSTTTTVTQVASGGCSTSVTESTGNLTLTPTFSQTATGIDPTALTGDLSQDVHCLTDIPNAAPETAFVMFQSATGFLSETIIPPDFTYSNGTGGWTWSYDSGDVTLDSGTDPNWGDFLDTGHLTGTITITRNNTVYTWTMAWTWNVSRSFANGMIFTNYDSATMDYSGTSTLSTENTAADVMADIEGNLLSTWNFNDRLQYPLLNVSWTGIVPKVSRNEQGPTSPIYFSTTAWSDPNAALFDGSILGAPSTAGGYGPEDYFDFRYVNHAFCCVGCTGGYIRGYGGWRSASSMDGNLPRCATQWTNAADIYYGQLAIGRNRLVNAGGIWASKWAESGIRFPSYNHARPFGADRWLVDETQVGCVTSFDGTTAYFSNPVSLPAGQTVAMSGTGSDGLYTVTAGGAGVYSITVSYASALPGGFSYWDSPVCALLRFPNCAPMAGRLAVASVTDNHDGTVTVVTDAAPVPLDWRVNLCSAAMTALAGDLIPAASSTTTFVVTATFADVSTAKWVTLYGALPGDPTQTGVARWYWNDTAGKGNFVLMEWTADKRTAGEVGRLGTTSSSYTDCNGTVWTVPYISGDQFYNPDGTPNYGYSSAGFSDECKGFVACAPWMIVLSPNAADTPPAGTGVRFDFSGGVELDSTYGTQQSMMCSQAMSDPLWQSPHESCGGGDAPTCIPLVEARCILPYASSQTVPPDNGAGLGQNEAPPSFCPDYTMLSPVTNTGANVEGPPYSNCSSQSQPVCIASGVTDGQFTGC